MLTHGYKAHRQNLIYALGLDIIQITLIEAIEGTGCFAQKLSLARQRGLLGSAA